MGVYIKGMEMPSTGLYFISVDNTGGRDKTIVTVERMLGNRDVRQVVGSFELVPVPPHGRLVDADALLERFEKEEKAADEHGRDFSFSFKSGGENCTEWWPVQQMLMDAPTIIPAEEGEHG